MTLTDAIAALRRHYGHRFSLDLQINVDKHGASEVEWTTFDPIQSVREEASSLDALVAIVTDPTDTPATIDAAGVGEIVGDA